MSTSSTRGKVRRIGRPTLAESVDSRRLILDTARETFANKGYEATTNRGLAEAAGMTTGTLYHHFDSKAALFCAVYEEVVNLIADRFVVVATDHQTLPDRLDAVFDEAHRINAGDPSVSRFVGASYVDLQRSKELRTICAPHVAVIQGFFGRLVSEAIANGELAAEDEEDTLTLINILTLGLTIAASGSNERNGAAVDTIKAFLRGRAVTRQH